MRYELLKKNSFHAKCNYKIDYICEVIFYRGDEKNVCIGFATELFFEKVLIEKNKQIVLFYSYFWHL